MNICPYPNCSRELEGRHAVLCSDHYFELSPGTCRFLTRVKIGVSRARSMKDREYLESQLNGYIRTAINKAISQKPVANKKEKSCVS